MGERSKANYILRPIIGTTWWLGGKALAPFVRRLPLSSQPEQIEPGPPQQFRRPRAQLASRRITAMSVEPPQLSPEERAERNAYLEEKFGTPPELLNRFDRGERARHHLKLQYEQTSPHFPKAHD